MENSTQLNQKLSLMDRKHKVEDKGSFGSIPNPFAWFNRKDEATRSDLSVHSLKSPVI